MNELYSLIENWPRSLATVQHCLKLEVETSPRTLVFHYHKTKLYHYQSKQRKKGIPPVLIVFATVNRPDILDLAQEYSFIRGLLQQGLDVYLIDWGYPDHQDKDISFSDYVTVHLAQCAGYLTQSIPAINLIGICQGGLMSLCYTAISKKVKNLVLISTPVDFATKDNLLAKLINQVMKTGKTHEIQDNMPGALLNQLFISLKPFELIGKKYLYFIDKFHQLNKTEKFLRMERWLADTPDQTAASWKQLAEEFYEKNLLIKNKISLNGHSVLLNNIHLPVLNLIASADHIVPPSASKPLKKYISTQDYRMQQFNTGHIGLYVSQNESKQVQRAIAQWLIER